MSIILVLLLARLGFILRVILRSPGVSSTLIKWHHPFEAITLCLEYRNTFLENSIKCGLNYLKNSVKAIIDVVVEKPIENRQNPMVVKIFGQNIWLLGRCKITVLLVLPEATRQFSDCILQRQCGLILPVPQWDSLHLCSNISIMQYLILGRPFLNSLPIHRDNKKIS